MRLVVEEPDSEKLAQAEACWLQAHAAYDRADFPAAAESYKAASALYESLDPPSFIDSLLGWALCLDHLGCSDEGAEVHRRVIVSAAASPAQKNAARRNLVYAAGVRNFGNADFAAAHACFAKALALQEADDDFRSDILMWLGACHSQMGQFAAAEETYHDLMVSDGAHESVKSQASQHQTFAEGHLLFGARRYKEAQGKFEKLLRVTGAGNEFRGSVTLMLAHCSFHLAEFGQASRRYRQILKTRNASPEQKNEARQWRRALPGLLVRGLRLFGIRPA
jgi:tetratricopeptide (TPR) repeat protein